MTASLEVISVTRRFDDLVAVDDVSFQVHKGEICGFIGPNGAGKTTTMRICATLDLPDQGDVLVGGRSVLVDPRGVRRALGFMPERDYGAYEHTTIREYLDFYARAYGLAGRRRTSTVLQVAEFTSLDDRLETEMAHLSKGMRQRLCLAKTLLHDPDLLILDEPASGLDPRARVELRELVATLAQGGKAVLISSHILTELAEICSHLAVIERGRLVADGTVDGIKKQMRRTQEIEVRCLGDLEVVERFLLESPGVGSVRRVEESVRFELEGDDERAAALLAEMVRRDLRPISFASVDADLEDLFLQLTEGKVQ